MLKIYDDIMGKTNLTYAYNTLKQNILRLDLKPGQELKEPELQTKLRMSRTPIREAMILLKHEGLVETLPHSGTCVSKIDKKRFKDGRMMRVCLETKMLELACDEFPQEYLERLEGILKRQEYILDTIRDYIEFHNLDIEFHRTIFEGVDYATLFHMAYNGFYDYLRVRQLNSSSKIKDTFVLDGHKKIYNIIKEKKREDIEDVLQEHFSRLNPKLEEFIIEYPHYFK
ncbi:HTH-type transcriptional repressor RspR [Fusobacterium sp. DD29]|uniref:GntR family transcriptional regulator n=1 Tax=unclassified Fusobacterium TaxID=2648384 RepID=UPI001B8C54AA|nr:MULTISPECIES: GntR family transcriptional regulator [unclassified Fusobacterium]MBR8750547.1 HTH-type transcriptional repressor RspR [Fusobacterium sp. DD29]MBR8762794.1 HTH-type transcriptional repressor RspR [Fusobacterium sp. DD25]MBR8768813.1 HTH-type transcriptional repressor RspR [Fusobacterium sp. DD43]MBR8772891.1 HTH-type transcriptional repressor RspR [Fusobacterium sp. DD40]MBR8777106.1 HTH-type transcriptional repressor RspR [Fusobacterium sp. DD17]